MLEYKNIKVMKTVEELIEADIENKNCSIDKEYAEEFDDTIRNVFLNKRWHNGNEVPKFPNSFLILFSYPEADMELTGIITKEIDWKSFTTNRIVCKWCYLQDLL